jgi:hypothetical protein
MPAVEMVALIGAMIGRLAVAAQNSSVVLRAFPIPPPVLREAIHDGLPPNRDDDHYYSAAAASAGTQEKARNAHGRARRAQVVDDLLGWQLASAPASVYVSGLQCNPSANGRYAIHPAPLRSRPQYYNATGTTTHYIYWSDIEGGAWVIDDDNATTTGSVAILQSSSFFVPPGLSNGWVESCPSSSASADNTCRYAHDGECDDGSHGGPRYCLPHTDRDDCTDVPVSLTLFEVLSGPNCAALAIESLEHFSCAESTPVTSQSQGFCSTACAFIYLEQRDRCQSAVQRTAFDGAGYGSTFSTVCSQAVQAALSAAPDTLHVSGFTCYTSANTQYTKQTQAHNERPSYSSGQWMIYWSLSLEMYVFDNNLDDTAILGYISAHDTETVPSGAVHAREQTYSCGGQFRDTILNIDESVSQANCAALATQILNAPSCMASSGDPGRFSSASCSAACAELWLPARDRCSQHIQAFDAVAGPNRALSRDCMESAAAVLATQPSSLSISGVVWHPHANGEYLLQQVPLNGRPQYATANGQHTLFWSSVSSSGSTACWHIDGTDVEIDSPSDQPPLGSAVWQEINRGTRRYVNSRIELQPHYVAGWCTSALTGLSPALPEKCCSAGDGPTCGDRVAPTQCTADCANMWRPWQQRCGLVATYLQSFPLAQFFDSMCLATSASLDLVDSTAVLGDPRQGQQASFHDFTFQAFSGRRYEATLRVADNGVQSTGLFIMGPGVSDIASAVVAQNMIACDRGAGFTASASGAFTLRIRSYRGGGNVSATVKAVGTSLHRAPPLIVDGQSHPLHVHCYFDACSYDWLDTPVLDGDNRGFDVKFEPTAGRAYAFVVHSREPVQVKLTVYEQGAVEGAAGFGSVVAGPTGSWQTTAPGHQSWLEYKGCTNGDQICNDANNPLYASVPVHPGETFGTRLVGTWVAPASGPVLVHVELACDVPFWSDINIDGCTITSSSMSCPQSDAEVCSSGLTLTVTSGAYFDASGNEIRGRASSTSAADFDASTVETMVRQYFDSIPTQMRTLPRSPRLQDMLVSGSRAAHLLAQTFTSEQLPHIIYPTSIERLSSTDLALHDSSSNAPSSPPTWQAGQPVAGVRVVLQAKAPSQEESDAALDGILRHQSGCTEQGGPSDSHRRLAESEANQLLQRCEARSRDLQQQVDDLSRKLEKLEQTMLEG